MWSRMRWHSRSRRTSGPYALTLAAFEGRGIGSVVIQWLTRNIGARSGPRLGRQVSARPAGSVSCAGRGEREGRLLGDRLVGEVVPRCRAGVVLGEEDHALVAVDQLAQRRPVGVAGRTAVHQGLQLRPADRSDEVLR